MVDVKESRLIRNWVATELHQMQGGRTLQVNDQDQIVQ